MLAISIRSRRLFVSLVCTVLLTTAGCHTLRPNDGTVDAFQARIPFEHWDQQHMPDKRRGCPVPADYKKAPIVLAHHLLVSDSEGNIPKDPESNRHHGRFTEAFRTILGHYAEVANSHHQNGKEPPRLLFYFNGGLNAQAEVEDQAERQIPCMLADGYYPIFFVWDTDALPSYQEQITRVYDGQLRSEPWIKARAPLLVSSDVIDGIANAPLNAAVESRRFWRGLVREPACTLLVRPRDLQLDECKDEKDGLFSGSEVPSCSEEDKIVFTDQYKGNNPPESLVAANRCADGHQTELSKALGYSALWPVRFFTAPLAHGLGDATWRNYLRRTRTTVRRAVEFDPDRYQSGHSLASKDSNEFSKLMDHYPKGTGVFARFFEALYQYSRNNGTRFCANSVEGLLCNRPSTDPEERLQDDEIAKSLYEARITLIGHSMGGIVINELVDRFHDLPYTDIVVMASAASWRDTARIMTSYFEDLEERLKKDHAEKSPSDVRFYSLMLHPLNEVRERTWYGVIPSGSLLVWIDEMYEVPKSPGDKTFGYWPTAKAGRRMFGHAAQIRTLYRIFDRPERKDVVNPVTHGDFNDDRMCFWRPAFWGVDRTPWRNAYKDIPHHALKPCRAS